MQLRRLTLSKSREAYKGESMMRDIGAYFYYAKKQDKSMDNSKAAVFLQELLSSFPFKLLNDD